LEVEDVALLISDCAGIGRNPDDAAVFSIRFNFEVGDVSMLLQSLNKLLATAGIQVKGVLDVRDCSDEFFSRIEAEDPCLRGVGQQESPVSSALEDG
jgi:hypothetical protein